jgi:hypothetical protein
MKNSKTSLIINTLVKLSVVAILIIAATTNQKYGFYNFVRWSVMVPSIYFAYKSYDKKIIGLVIYFSAIAILFNPFQKFWFQKDTWHLIDYLIAGITTATIIFDWVQIRTTNKLNSEN